MLSLKLHLLRLKMTVFCLAATSLAGMTGCKKNADQDQTQASDAAAIRDIHASRNVGGERFDILCKNGDPETRTDREIARQEVCEGERPSYLSYPSGWTYGNAPAACAGDAIMRGFSSEQATRLCRGARNNSPAVCAGDAIMRGFSAANATVLCRGARDKSPAICAGDAVMRGFGQERAVTLCSPESYHDAPHPRPGHGGYPPPFPYQEEYFRPRPN